MEELCEAIEASLSWSSSKSLGKQATNSINHILKKYAQLIRDKRIPEFGWKESEIEQFLHVLSSMDSNNFAHHVGVGEREGRIICPLTYRRHYGFAHGIGRSGNMAEIQPKAAGSAILQGLVNCMTRHALIVAGYHKRVVAKCSVCPVATGMALGLVFGVLRKSRPEARYIAWIRIDQKSCLKSIFTAGYIPIVIKGELVNDQVRVTYSSIRQQLNNYDCADILCVVSCSSCFAPRAFDNLPEIGLLCNELDIPHIVNNAYGVQSSKAVHLINETVRTNARLDAFVQSTDKNFMVPVGGSIIAGPSASLVDCVESSYPGRASSSPLIDLLTTFLYLGVRGYRGLLEERKANFDYFKRQLAENGLEALCTPHNDISIAIKMNSSRDAAIGGQLFIRGVSGARFVDPSAEKTIEGITFKSFGAHFDDYPHAYLTVAAAIGTSKQDIDNFFKILGKLKTKGTNGNPLL